MLRRAIVTVIMLLSMVIFIQAQPVANRASYPPPSAAWKASVVTLVSARTADIVSTEMSRGGEANPLIPVRGNGKPAFWVYGGTAALIVGVIILQRAAIERMPRHSRWRRAFTAVNFTVGGVGWGVAAHNWNVR